MFRRWIRFGTRFGVAATAVPMMAPSAPAHKELRAALGRRRAWARPCAPHSLHGDFIYSVGDSFTYEPAAYRDVTDFAQALARPRVD